MSPQITQRPNNYASRYDAFEVLMIAGGVLLIVAITFVL
jgi:hypothetical protein